MLAPHYRAIFGSNPMRLNSSKNCKIYLKFLDGVYFQFRSATLFCTIVLRNKYASLLVLLSAVFIVNGWQNSEDNCID